MKPLLIIALTFAGITLSTPQAEARDRRDHYRSHNSYRYERSSYGRGYDCGDRGSRGYYSHRSYYSSPRRYYRPSRSYYYSDRCESRRSYRAPHISFLFGF